jgi:hypothetical protein
VLRSELETFLARAAARERPAPRFGAREPRAFLRCGVSGFARWISFGPIMAISAAASRARSCASSTTSVSQSRRRASGCARTGFGFRELDSLGANAPQAKSRVERSSVGLMVLQKSR